MYRNKGDERLLVYETKGFTPTLMFSIRYSNHYQFHAIANPEPTAAVLDPFTAFLPRPGQIPVGR